MPPYVPQVPDVYGRWLVGGHHQTRAVGAECQPTYAAQVGTFEPRECAACLDLDQANDPVWVLDGHQPAVGGEEATDVRDLSYLAPGAGFPEPRPWISRD